MRQEEAAMPDYDVDNSKNNNLEKQNRKSGIPLMMFRCKNNGLYYYEYEKCRKGKTYRSFPQCGIGSTIFANIYAKMWTS